MTLFGCQIRAQKRYELIDLALKVDDACMRGFRTKFSSDSDYFNEVV